METATQVKTAVRWFDLPATDLARAARFYASIFELPIHVADFGGRPIAVFPYEHPGIGGSLVEGTPSKTGALVYLSAEGRLHRTLALVRECGGTVVQPAVELPNGIGWMAIFDDLEGNRVGLHAERA